jgi:hypothetical protein
MKISEIVTQLRQRNSLLYYFGMLHIILLGICFIMYWVDDTLVMGVNAWIKPMKFAISIAIYSWTYGWLTHYLTSKGTRRFISWVLVICMTAEIVIITLQAARGELSHYNISTPLNAMLFSTMGTFIGINTVLNFYTTILFFIPGSVSLSNPSLLAWRVALLLFFVGSISGGLMITHMGHTFGAADGGPGLPFTNWSTQAGDMRAAHFITLHGLQAIPLFTNLVARRTTRPTVSIALFSTLYVVLCLALHFLALNQIPLITL